MTDNLKEASKDAVADCAFEAAIAGLFTLLSRDGCGTVDDVFDFDDWEGGTDED